LSNTVRLAPTGGLIFSHPDKSRISFSNHLSGSNLDNGGRGFNDPATSRRHPSDYPQWFTNPGRIPEGHRHSAGYPKLTASGDRPTHGLIENRRQDSAMRHPQVAFVQPGQGNVGPDTL